MWLSQQAIPPRPSFLIFNYLQAAHIPKEQSHLTARLLIKMMRTEHLATLPMWIVALDFSATGPVHTALSSSRKTRVLLFCDYILILSKFQWLILASVTRELHWLHFQCWWNFPVSAISSQCYTGFFCYELSVITCQQSNFYEFDQLVTRQPATYSLWLGWPKKGCLGLKLGSCLINMNKDI